MFREQVFRRTLCMQDLHRGSGLVDEHKVFFRRKKNRLPREN